MTNARCLTEGVDMPSIDCVAFIDSKKSKVDIVQAAGRALRLSKGKKFGYILIPIFVPDHIELIEAAEEQGYDDVAITVRALATSDRRIVEYLRAISEGRKPKGGSPVDGKISINQLHKIEAEKFDDSIKLKVWDKVAVTNYKSFKEVQEFALKNGITSQNEWIEFTKKNVLPKDIPYSVAKIYENNGWKNWGDFLKTGNLPSHLLKFCSYKEAQKIVHHYKVTSGSKYKKFILEKKNTKYNLPKAPHVVYDEWTSWPEFLQVDRKTVNTKYLTYKELKKIVKKEGIKTMQEYHKFLEKRPSESLKFPWKLDMHYKSKGWISRADFFFFQNFYYKRDKFPSFEEAKKIIQKFELRTVTEFSKLIRSKKLNILFPSAPNVVYKSSWQGWEDFLGYSLYTYDECKKIIKIFKIKDSRDYKKKIDFNKYYKIPKAPSVVYGNNNTWINWMDFLGKQKMYTLDEAKKIVQKFNFKSGRDLYENFNFKKYPLFPKSGGSFYRNNPKWKGWEDFLSKKSK